MLTRIICTDPLTNKKICYLCKNELTFLNQEYYCNDVECEKKKTQMDKRQEEYSKLPPSWFRKMLCEVVAFPFTLMIKIISLFVGK